MKYKELFGFVSELEEKIKELLKQDKVNSLLKPYEMNESVTSYLYRPAKRLRPAVFLMACGCLNKEVQIDKVLPIALGIELFHTWTLVHDDIIDNDHLRRGDLTVHKKVEQWSMEELGLNAKEAKEYGMDVAILAGDIQQAWAINFFANFASKNMEYASVILKLISLLETEVIDNLIYGEVLDVKYSFAFKDIEKFLSLDESEIIHMLWLKTGVLYHFSALAGASVALKTDHIEDPNIVALSEFAGKCGIAFQLQDDILGIVGTEDILGKPIGSDIREGKKTVILLEALKNATAKEKDMICKIVGNKNATDEEIQLVTKLLGELGGIEYTKKLAQKYILEALPYLENIEDSEYKRLLLQWADFMYDREF